MFLGRSSDALGTYEVWVPSINRKVRSSSVTVDEEHFPWLGAEAHQPLMSAVSSARYLKDHLGTPEQVDAASSPADFVRPGDINKSPRPSLTFLNMFSGPYERKGGLSNTMRAFGWNNVFDFDNDAVLGGGWQDDLLNDQRYTEMLHLARAGAFDAIMCGFPCTTTTVARCFDASGDGGDSGPPPLCSQPGPRVTLIHSRPPTHSPTLPGGSTEPQKPNEQHRTQKTAPRGARVKKVLGSAPSSPPPRHPGGGPPAPRTPPHGRQRRRRRRRRRRRHWGRRGRRRRRRRRARASVAASVAVERGRRRGGRRGGRGRRGRRGGR